MKQKRSFLLNVRVIFTAVVMGGVLVTIVGAIILTWLLSLLPFPVQLPLPVWLILFCIVTGSATTTFVNLKILTPIVRLSRAMRQVTDGNFDVTLDASSSFNELQEAYRSFNLMTKELRATEILQTDFVSNVSHEFKTPINAIEGYATLAQNEDLSPEERRAYVDKIIFNTKRLSELVSNILLLSKIDNQTIQNRRDRYRLDEQIRRSIVLLEPRWTEKDIEFDVDLAEISYLGNESLMLHVWNNLIDNAIKFDPQGGYVGITMILDGAEIVVTVEDNGPGIPEEAQKHIFDKFYQTDGSHKDEGNGLGLALVRQILTLCGGNIFVENRQAGGCRFTVRFPME